MSDLKYNLPYRDLVHRVDKEVLVFPYKDPAEVLPYVFDFSNMMIEEEDSITDVEVSITLKYGEDDSDLDEMILNEPTINGKTVTQIVSGGVSHCNYVLRLEATTASDKVIVARNELPVRIAPLTQQ